MGKKPVDDNFNEVLRKAAQDSSDATKYDLRTILTNDKISVDDVGIRSLEQEVTLDNILEVLKEINMKLSMLVE